jgi:hypothetical protein
VGALLAVRCTILTNFRKHGSDPVELLTMFVSEGFSLFVKSAKLEPAQFWALVDRLCADNNIP